MKSFRVTSFESERAEIASELSPLTKQPVKIGSFSPSRRPFAGGWKPVIDGKVQISIEFGVASEKAGKGEEAAMAQTPAASSLSPKHPPAADNVSSASGATATSEAKKYGNESDHESERVEVACKNGWTCSKGGRQSGHFPASQKRSGASADKEHKRLKRLLRNRVSAQQARERKKVYLSDLEVRSMELEQMNAELEERVSTLIKENFMLRQIVRNTAMKNAGGGSHSMEN